MDDIFNRTGARPSFVPPFNDPLSARQEKLMKDATAASLASVIAAASRKANTIDGAIAVFQEVRARLYPETAPE